MTIEIANSICIFFNSVTLMILSIVCYKLQKQIIEIRLNNLMIENQNRVLDRLTNFRYQQNFSEIDLTNKDVPLC